MIPLLVIVTYIATIALMMGVDWLTDGIIADAFGKVWPYSRRSKEDK